MKAISLFQTLYFKFTDHPESVKLIPRLGVESRGRHRTVFIALVAGILQVLAAAIFIGTFPGISLIPGVILSHLTIIDIESKGDGGQLFMLAIAVWVCCVIIMMMMYQQQEIALLKKFRKSQLNIVFR